MAYAEVISMSAHLGLANEIIVERHSECPVTTAISIIAGKWKPTILCEIREGPRRFSDLRRDIPGISEKVLSPHGASNIKTPCNVPRALRSLSPEVSCD